MNTLLKCLMGLALTALACKAEPTWDELQEQFSKALGPEWTIAKDFHSFIAVRKDAKLLGRISRIDAIIGSDPWDRALQSDYSISIILRPKLTLEEYRGFEQLRARLISKRTKGMDPASKETFEKRSIAEDAIELPKFFIGNSAVYLRSTAERFYDVRPESIEKSRTEITRILETNCERYPRDKE